MLFDELVNNKRMNDPVARTTEELKRSNKPSKLKIKSSSVDIKTYRRGVIIIGTIVTIIVVVIIGFLVLQGIRIFVGA